MWTGANQSLESADAGDPSALAGQETVEAALNRLSKAYKTAVECLAALYKAERNHDASDEIGRENLRRVAQSARAAFEDGILRDPLVRNLTNRWTRLSLDLGAGEDLTFSSGRRVAQLRSKGHKASVQRLVFLSLSNYADLLVAGSQSPSARSPVYEKFHQPLKTFSDRSCWAASIAKGNSFNSEGQIVSTLEPEETTIRLALAAYVDASEIDSSDPTLFLKIAALAHRLGRRVHSTKYLGIDIPVSHIPFRKMERYCLERAVAALPSRVAPNRTAVRALRLWWEQEEASRQRNYNFSLTTEKDPDAPRTISIPRHSWSLVGRMLVHVSRRDPDSAYPNQLIKLHLSPLLTLSYNDFSRILSFLDTQEVPRLEATCRSISVSVARAKAIVDQKAAAEDSNAEPSMSTVSKQAQVSKVPFQESKDDIGGDNDVAEKAATEEDSGTSNRASKRLRSQLISSGKRYERGSRRKSVEFCLVAATLGYDVADKAYQKLLKAEFDWGVPAIGGTVGKTLDGEDYLHRSKERRCLLRRDSASFGGALLIDFVNQMAHTPRAPLAVLFQYVAFVSTHVDILPCHEVDGLSGTPAMILDCINEIKSQIGCPDDILFDNPTLWTRLLALGFAAESLQLHWFAILLLEAELRFVSCNRDDCCETDYDSPTSTVSNLIRQLKRMDSIISDESIETDVQNESTVALRTRYFWLLGVFCIHRGKLSQNVSDSRQAEVEGISAVEKALAILRQSAEHGIRVVRIPHLVASGIFLRELSVEFLSSFIAEIKSSSVLLRTREQFWEVLSQIDPESEDLTPDHCSILAAVGEGLATRYLQGDCSDLSQFAELVGEIVSEHGEFFLGSSYDDEDFSMIDGNGTQNRELSQHLNTVIPVGPVKSGRQLASLHRPCTLTIVLCSLQCQPRTDDKVFKLLANLCLCITEMGESRRQSFGRDKWKWLDDSPGLGNCDRSGYQKSDAEWVKARQNSIVLRFLLEKLLQVGSDTSWFDSQPEFTAKALPCLIHHSMRYVSFWFGGLSRMDRKGDLNADSHLLQLIHSIVEAINEISSNATLRTETKKQFVIGLCGILREQKTSLATYEESKNVLSVREKNKVLMSRAHFLALVCCELGQVMSEHSFSAGNKADVTPNQSIFGKADDLTAKKRLAGVCDSLIWLWHFTKRSSSKLHAVTSLLQVPVGLAVVGVCGVVSSTMSLSGGRNTRVCLEEFYDSDNSAFRLSDTEMNCSEEDRQNILRITAQIVHCVDGIVSEIDASVATNYSHVPRYRTSEGIPLLPLATVRILNRLADLLLSFSSEPEDPSTDEYPFGTRTTGTLVDKLLCRAYKSLHGLSLASSSDRDALNVSSEEVGKSRSTRPECPEAAAQLWRCIMRLYAHGRKTPPKDAIDCVLDALPEIQQTTETQSLQEFVFSPNDNVPLSGREFRAFVSSQHPKLDEFFSETRAILFDNQGIGPVANDADASIVLRKEIMGYIAQGPVPQYQDSSVEKQQRSAATRHEEELARMFLSILNCLTMETNRCSKEAVILWVKGAQCLSLKADLIADRLGLSTGFCRNTNFAPDVSGSVASASSSVLDDLVDEQYNEDMLLRDGWCPHIGTNLSGYVTFSWSSLESLEDFSQAVEQDYEELNSESNDISDKPELLALNKLSELRSKDAGAWQRAWGGLFIVALRQLACRCRVVGMYCLLSLSEDESDRHLAIEIVESLGMNFYSELMHSQVYGYPMVRMSQYRRRDVAETAIHCFRYALNAAREPEPGSQRQTWDLLFMMGKCEEKISKTYSREVFSANRTRLYEKHFSRALEFFHSSYVEAKKLEEENELVVDRSGGSSHGSTEALYRLHASRLKCLIAAVEREEDERRHAEEEALRLTECYWYDETDRQSKTSSLSVRERVWNVLCDVVLALVQCRVKHNFFHRSVYRHAQALMWAPILHDPFGSLSPKSHGVVPATKACRLRGFNYSTDAATSAQVVIGALFERRRTQLCAVWVTNSDETVFEAINNTVRKYDRLRGKYVAAYLETLLLCRRKNELEQFLKLCYQAKRDLPSYFDASAAVSGEGDFPHAGDSLLARSGSVPSLFFLTGAKRRANSALATAVLEEAKATASSDGKLLEDLLKISYACFLRLNCKERDIAKGHVWKSYRGSSSGSKQVAACLSKIFLKLYPDESSGPAVEWNAESQGASAMRVALRKCKDLFPSITGNYFSRKGSREKKGQKRKATSDDSTLPRSDEVNVQLPSDSVMNLS